MSKITRRGLLGAGGGLLGAGLAGCGGNGEDSAPVRSEVRLDTRAPYAGKVAFQHGVASGDPLADRVILWTRVTPVTGEGGPVPVSYGVFEDAAGEKSVAFGLATAEPGRDYCVKVDVGGLKPGKEYFYRFVARHEGGELSSGALARTKTLPEKGAVDTLKFAVISCSNFPFGFFNVYRELGKLTDIDAIMHLGDYIYEYGIDGYGGDVGSQIGRDHNPPLEIITLADYRTRHAQYKADPDTQAAHSVAPWLCTWDDHESANNSYRTGAENHNPEEDEGDWSDRKQAAVQAYLEWMPVRDPEPGRIREAIYRKFEYGDIATVFCLESRLTGRSDEISWFTELAGKAPADVPLAAAMTMQKVNSAERTMLGKEQEDWLAKGFASSVKAGTAWQFLANQVILAKVKPPALLRTLTEEQIAAQSGYMSQLIQFSPLGLPQNLDAWDGFPAARERLYASAKAAGARLVTVTGDTHTAWANDLHDDAGELRGVEFGCTSVTSPGFGKYVVDIPDLGQQYADANPDVLWYDLYGHGWTLVTLTKDAAKAEYFKVSTILEQDYTVESVYVVETHRDGAGMTPLAEV